MEKAVRDCLHDILQDLTKDELKNFKFKLNGFKLKKGYNNITMGKLEKASPVDLTRYILSYYAQDYGMKVTVDVLKSINKKDLAQKLSETLRPGPADIAVMDTGTKCSEILHREQKRLTEVLKKRPDALLRELQFQAIITAKEHNAWRRNKPEEKVRRSIDKVLHQGEAACQQFLESLKNLPHARPCLNLISEYSLPGEC
ncbi:hypothetical protein KIL84_007889 [Mauremys mutica]|uniref:Uncharacterized protein n=1 Tax=Mauremys mutica TaxID=74926 RepID=A0A9D3X3N3_9SAUR|nr:hypothetical protein KIL84_007889 [Mauremys mutica]